MVTRSITTIAEWLALAEIESERELGKEKRRGPLEPSRRSMIILAETSVNFTFPIADSARTKLSPKAFYIVGNNDLLWVSCVHLFQVL